MKYGEVPFVCQLFNIHKMLCRCVMAANGDIVKRDGELSIVGSGGESLLWFHLGSGVNNVIDNRRTVEYIRRPLEEYVPERQKKRDD